MRTEERIRAMLQQTPGDIPAFRGEIERVVARVKVRRWRKRATAIAVSAVVVAGVGLPLALLYGLTGSPHPAVSPSPPSPLVHPVLAAQTRVPAGTVDVAVGDGRVWVSGFGAVSRLDPATDRIVGKIRTPGTEDYSRIAVGEGSIWVTADGGIVYRIDPATNRVIATVHVGGPVQGIAVGAGRVWVTRPTGGAGDLIRVDPETNRVVGSPIKVGPGPTEVTYGLGAVWVENTSPPSVMRVDPATGHVSTVPVVGVVAVGYGSLWAASNDSVTRFDPQTGQILATVNVPRAQAVAIGAGEVWVLASPRSSSPTLFYPIKHTAALWEVDPRTNRITGKASRLDAIQPIAITASSESVWIADYNSGTITRFSFAT
jgi:virginiamycin B lyase